MIKYFFVEAPPITLNPRYNKRFTKATNAEDIRKMLMGHCGCKKDCFKKISQGDVQECRKRYHKKTKQEKKEYLAQEFAASDFTKDGIQDPQHNILIGFSEERGGTSVCTVAWYMIHGISRAT